MSIISIKRDRGETVSGYELGFRVLSILLQRMEYNYILKIEYHHIIQNMT